MFSHSDGLYLQIEDTVIYTHSVGKATNPVLVLLHGGLGSMLDFNNVAEALSEHYYLVGIDLRGHGRSPRGLASMSYDQHCEDVLKVLDALSIESCALLGSSDGGIVSYLLAANHPQRIASIVTMGSHWRNSESDVNRSILEELNVPLWRGIFSKHVAQYHEVNPSPDFCALMDDVKALWQDQAAYSDKDMNAIRCPALLMRGQDDDLFSAEDANALLESNGKFELATIRNARHDLLTEPSYDVLSTIHHFLKTNSTLVPTNA
uniref:alpha/beta fold hydrolase n=1 Tax=Thaumasiovibrio occultus TaxID=1891184 RepID=UPI000B34B881|nr:alpha/beta hydrolase [Thaumasiovibrio occultus]